MTPSNIIIVPILSENVLKGVIELGSIQQFSDKVEHFLSKIGENIAINIISAQSRYQMRVLLEESQKNTEELAVQQEELRSTNEELEVRSQSLENNEISLRQQKDALENANKQLERTRQEIEKKAKELEISSRYKSEFLANMSHELRTPLNSMLILSEQLAENDEKNLTDDQIESAQIIYHGGQDLLQLINDILDLSKIEAGKMILDSQSLDLLSFSDMFKSNFKAIAAKNDLDFHINLSQDLPHSIETDEQKLAQIIKNLLSNAFKFTAQGSVTLDFKLIDSKIAITVHDTGIGIPKNKQQEIFEAFQQVDGSTSRQYGGTGLGLSISRELTKVLGGTLHCQSVEKEGSSFTLSFPLKKSQSKENVKPPETNIEESLPIPTKEETSLPSDEQDKDLNLKNKKILIIDDDMRNLFALSGALQKKGMEIFKAINGKKALEMLDNDPAIDLILMDIMMPVMDGYDTMRAIRAQIRFKDLPIIALTAKAMKDDRGKCISAGANDYLTKPIEINKLFSLIRVWLSKKKNH